MIDIPPYQPPAPPAPEPIRWQYVYPEGFDPEKLAAMDGNELTGEFRLPIHMESWLSTGGGFRTCYGSFLEPRLIVRKRKVKKLLLTQIRMEDARNGDFCQDEGGSFCLLRTGHVWPIAWGRNCSWYRLTEVTE